MRGEPWDLDEDGDLVDTEGKVVSCHVISGRDPGNPQPEELARMAAYSRAFHDIEDPEAWRLRVQQLLGDQIQ